MSPRENRPNRKDELERQIERYREAADFSLEQLEWTVGYLNRIRRPQIAKVLDHNRKQILERMR